MDVDQTFQGVIMLNVSTARPMRHLQPRRADRLARIREQVGAMIAQPLGADERRDLLQICELRKLARDLYSELARRWGALALVHVGIAEEAHLDAIGALLEHDGLADPLPGRAVGESGDPQIRALHAQLAEMGLRSEMAAFQVGLLVEELGLRDLSAARSRTHQPEITAVYDDLMRSSRNHMRTFFRQMQRFEGEYVPQYLALTDFEAIVWTQPEPC